MNSKKIIQGLAGALVGTLMLVTPALAATPFSLFGKATSITNGASLVSDTSNTDTSDDFSGIGLSIPSGMTFADITALSTTFNVTDDDCIGGSPRFQIHLNTAGGTKSMFVYLGPVPNFTGCGAGDINSGNLINSTENRFDLTQLGGPFMGTYTDALAYAGGLTVLGVQIVADSGWAFPDMEQTVNVTNPLVSFATPTTKDQCKGNGWMSFSSPAFKNQGQCVGFFASGGKNIK